MASDDGAPDRREYYWNLAAAVVLSLATLASAWCGYQASAWNSVNSTESRSANDARIDAVKHTTVANRQTTSDLLVFSTWLQAELQEDIVLATEVEARFTEHFRPAFEAWLERPVEPGQALPPGSPFELAEYVLPAQQTADDANARAAEHFANADAAGGHSSRYVLTSVLFASVLFLGGIASNLASKRAAHGVVGVAGVALVLALRLLVTSPVIFDGF